MGGDLSRHRIQQGEPSDLRHTCQDPTIRCVACGGAQCHQEEARAVEIGQRENREDAEWEDYCSGYANGGAATQRGDPEDARDWSW